MEIMTNLENFFNRGKKINFNIFQKKNKFIINRTSFSCVFNKEKEKLIR